MKFNITYIMGLFVIIILSSCQNNERKTITNLNDYNEFLNSEYEKSLTTINNELTFWTQKYEATPNQFPFLGKIASTQSQKFMISGDINALLESEANLIKLNKKTNYNNASYLRALARNYISQHKFKEALKLLAKAETNGENLRATQSMMFDVHLELDHQEEAVNYLEALKNFSDFDYLIRLSKYSDYKGDLDNAINYLEQALVIAEASNLKETKQWTYTNLADYYGHAGRIKESYEHYLKALAIDENDAYAKKGIAWIVYSYERNPREALRILNTVMQYNQSPDYFLLKSEIAEYMDNDEEKERNLLAFKKAISNKQYGDMYNVYNIELLSNDRAKSLEAIALAEAEVNNRTTPQTYDLLAWSYYKHGDVKKALELIEKYVINKTSEPAVLYHIAEIYKANGKQTELEALKKELLEATYELGPLMEESIKKI